MKGWQGILKKRPCDKITCIYAIINEPLPERKKITHIFHVLLDTTSNIKLILKNSEYQCTPMIKERIYKLSWYVEFWSSVYLQIHWVVTMIWNACSMSVQIYSPVSRIPTLAPWLMGGICHGKTSGLLTPTKITA